MKFSSSKGFTLIEIMIVVVILGILAAVIMPKIMSRPEQAKQTKAKTDIEAIQTALELYKMDNGFYPSTEQGLAALVKKPATEPLPANWQSSYLQQLPIDPWKHPYHYLNPGTINLESIDIFTFGPTGRAGEGTLGNWDLES